MSLQREAILQRIRDLLLWQTPAQDRVIVNKAEPNRRPLSGPLVSVYGLSEVPGQFQEEAQYRFIRTLTVAVDVELAEPTSPGASLALNTLCEQIERIILRQHFLPDAGGTPLANEVRWKGFELTINSESRDIVFGGSITFEVDYLYGAEEEVPANVRALLTVHTEPVVAGTPSGMGDDVGLQGG